MKPKAMRARSGAVNDADPLVAFLYLLLRDSVPAGEVERLIQDALKAKESGGGQFTNGWLARYARDCARRLGDHVVG